MSLEVMSPAGSLESVIAAVRGGADAVYFGAGAFNARRNAKNLDESELSEAMKYCRMRGVKTYLTVNTLLTDREIPQAHRLIEKLRDLGADAFIVQDLGMARLVATVAPGVSMHGSTQLTVHNLDGVKMAHRLGFSRIVLSRELPMSEVEFICKHSPIEVEIFVHGALCMCYSGQCYMSSAIGGRSGNRGLCAQPCRMPYSFGDEGKIMYPLSLKDLSLAKHLCEIEKIGVACIKIEGRMKRPEYTALVTKIYKDAVKSGRSPSAAELEKLTTLFSRDGFTDGFYTKNKGPHMFGVRQEGEAAAVRELHKQARAIYEAAAEPPCVGINFRFYAHEGEPMRLECVDASGNEYSILAGEPEKAINAPTGKGVCEGALLKTGGTIYYTDSVHVELGEGLRIQLSAINAMRRQCLEGISAMRRQPPKRSGAELAALEKREASRDGQGLTFQFLSAEQMSPQILALKPRMIYLPLDEIIKNLDIISRLSGRGHRFAAVLGRISFESENKSALSELELARSAGVRDVLCTNLGQINMLTDSGFALHGDIGLNIMNSYSLLELKNIGLETATLSFEMNTAQIRDMSFSIPCEMLVYGRFPLMITESCIIKNRTGRCSCKSGEITTVTDKTGRHFPVLRENGCRNTLYNSEPLWLCDKLDELSKLGVSSLRLMFTTEGCQECMDIAHAYANKKGKAPAQITRGLYFRGVE